MCFAVPVTFLGTMDTSCVFFVWERSTLDELSGSWLCALWAFSWGSSATDSPSLMIRGILFIHLMGGVTRLPGHWVDFSHGVLRWSSALSLVLSTDSEGPVLDMEARSAISSSPDEDPPLLGVQIWGVGHWGWLCVVCNWRAVSIVL